MIKMLLVKLAKLLRYYQAPEFVGVMENCKSFFVETYSRGHDQEVYFFRRFPGGTFKVTLDRPQEQGWELQVFEVTEIIAVRKSNSRSRLVLIGPKVWIRSHRSIKDCGEGTLTSKRIVSKLSQLTLQE